jgi:single-stranded-DNA-specific exonuclease
VSVLGKTWLIQNEDRSSSLLKKLLSNRGLNEEQAIERFFHPSVEHDFHDPFLMNDMKKAVERISGAIVRGERVMLFGDYDVDGITGTAILMRALTKLGAKVSYRLPHRIEDGYGMREKFIKEFKKLDVKLAITVDNGISCFNEIELANSLGIDVIITDHHTIPEKIPNAYAILHPKLPGSKYPFADLTGAGVALKFAQALYMERITDEDERNEEIKKLLDLACMGTIGDIGPLLGENRYIVKEGLNVLENTRWPGLSRLKQSAGIKGKLDSHDIGFLLSPRINAAGRIAHPKQALNLLLHDAERGEVLANELEQLNRKRQDMTQELMVIADTEALKQLKEPILIISDKSFHGGIIGLLAGKLAEKYFRPAIVMEERENVFIGSCRSIPGFNIVEILNGVKDLLPHYGGHAAAAGFDLPKENLKDFTKRVIKQVGKTISAKSIKPVIEIDCEISHNEITEKTIGVLDWFEPFGAANPTPRFVCRNIPLVDFGTVGANRKHLKIKTKLNGVTVDCIGFGLGQFFKKLANKKSLDVVCEIEKDNWNGNNKIQLKIVDFKIN